VSTCSDLFELAEITMSKRVRAHVFTPCVLSGSPFTLSVQPPTLISREEPVPEWYKDEGGKGNVLRFVVESPVALTEVNI
jgi:hypothetical protein